MHQPGFNKKHTQALMDFFVAHGSNLCKMITDTLIENDVFPKGVEDKSKLLFEGKDMRVLIRQDLIKLYELF